MFSKSKNGICSITKNSTKHLERSHPNILEKCIKNQSLLLPISVILKYTKTFWKCIIEVTA